MPEVHISFLIDGLSSLKRKELTGCDIKAVSCKVVDAKGDTYIFTDGLGGDTFDQYASI